MTKKARSTGEQNCVNSARLAMHGAHRLCIFWEPQMLLCWWRVVRGGNFGSEAAILLLENEGVMTLKMVHGVGVAARLRRSTTTYWVTAGGGTVALAQWVAGNIDRRAQWYQW
jgi:hypothetical protein